MAQSRRPPTRPPWGFRQQLGGRILEVPTFRGGNKAANSVGGTVSVVTPAVNGDLMIASVLTNAASPFGTSGFTPIGTGPAASGNPGSVLAIGIKVANNEPATQAFGSADGGFINVVLDAFYNANLSVPMDTPPTRGQGTAANIVFPDITSLTDNALHYAVYQETGAAQPGVPTGYNIRTFWHPTIEFGAFDRLKSPPGYISGITTVGGGSKWAAWSVLIRAASSDIPDLLAPMVAGPVRIANPMVGPIALRRRFRLPYVPPPPSVIVAGAVGSAVGTLGFTGVTAGLKGAIATQVGSVGLADTQQSATGRLGSSLGTVGLTDAEAGRKGALQSAVGAMGLSSAEAGAPGVIGSSVGRVGLSSTTAATRAALGTALGRVGLSSVAIAVKGALETYAGAVGLSGSEAGFGTTTSAKAGSGAGAVGMSASSIALRGALETGAGRLGLSAAAAAKRAALGAAVGAVGLSGAEAGGHVILGSATGAVGLSGSFFAAAGAARDPAVLGGGFTPTHGGGRRRGSARGAIGLTGLARGAAVVAEAANDTQELLTVDAELRAELERFESESPAITPTPREARGWARGTLKLVSFASGAETVTQLVEPVAPQRSVGFSAGSSSSSAGGGASGRGGRGGPARGMLRLVGSAAGVGRVPEGTPVIDEADLAIILYVLDQLDEAA